jgi:hypothetical protein
MTRSRLSDYQSDGSQHLQDISCCPEDVLAGMSGRVVEATLPCKTLLAGRLGVSTGSCHEAVHSRITSIEGTFVNTNPRLLPDSYLVWHFLHEGLEKPGTAGLNMRFSY